MRAAFAGGLLGLALTAITGLGVTHWEWWALFVSAMGYHAIQAGGEA